MAAARGKKRTAGRGGHRYGGDHLAGRGQARELDQAHRRRIRHPPQSPVLPTRASRQRSPAASISFRWSRSARPSSASAWRQWSRRRRSARLASAAKAIFPARSSLPSRRSKSNGRIARRWRPAPAPMTRSAMAISGGRARPARFRAIHERCQFASVAEHLANASAPRGRPFRCRPPVRRGASAIQLGVEAIRRGEGDAALCIGTDGSVNAESLIRFSLLSALSTANDPPQAAAKPFSKNRDGFVMAEGAAALVLESYAAATARGAKILGVLAGCGGDGGFVSTGPARAPDGKAIIGCIRNAIADAGLTPRRHRLHQPARHRHARERQDGISRSRVLGLRRARPVDSDFPPTSRWSGTRSRQPARWKPCSRC